MKSAWEKEKNSSFLAHNDGSNGINAYFCALPARESGAGPDTRHKPESAMKKTIILLLGLIGTIMQATAQTINLTPWPAHLVQKTGELVLPPTFAVCTDGLDEAGLTETRRFVDELRRTTGLDISLLEPGAPASTRALRATESSACST